MLAAVAALCPPPSHAAPPPSFAFETALASGPAVGGDRVLWGRYRMVAEDRDGRRPVFAGLAAFVGRNVASVRMPAPRVGRRRLGREENVIGGLAASGSHVAVLRGYESCDRDPRFGCVLRSELLVGRHGGPLRVVAEDPRMCSFDRDSIATSGRRLAYLECGRGGLRLVVRHVARPGARIVARGLGLREAQPGSARVRLAGRFVAWQDGLTPAIVVHDLVGGRRAFAIRMRRKEISGWDLAADGAIVLAAGPRSGSRRGVRHRLSYASPRRPRPRPLGIGAQPGEVRVHGDRFAFVSAAGELTLASRRGGRRAVERFDARRLLLGFDLGRGILAWAEQRVERIATIPNCTRPAGHCDYPVGPHFVRGARIQLR
ncbi:MAG TPA: hypothetical protein VF549_20985 [Solirubrobacteraceae bacterium]